MQNYLCSIYRRLYQIAIDEKQILLEAVLMISRNSYKIMSTEILASRATRFALLTTSPTTFTATTSILHVAGVVPIVRRHGIIENV